MTTIDAEELAVRWQHHKDEEQRHQAARRAIEDELVALYRIPADHDDTATFDTEHLTLKIAGRLDRKVDSEKVQELAAEFGIEAHLPALFRWKPELNVRAWDRTTEEIRKALSPAITTKPGRPSFQIAPKKEK